MVTLLLAVLFPLLMAFTAFYDLFSMRIPNWISIALIVIFAVVCVITQLELSAIGMHLAAAAIVFAVGFALFALRFIGGGDAKVASAIALWMGMSHLVEFIFYSSVFGGILTLVILAFRRFVPNYLLPNWPWLLDLHDKKKGAPYGIALAIGAMVVYAQTPIYTNIMLLG